MRLLRPLLVSLVLLAGCATAPKPISPDKCGNPCASVSCPSAFRCDVDAICAARCQPEPVPRH